MQHIVFYKKTLFTKKIASHWPTFLSVIQQLLLLLALYFQALILPPHLGSDPSLQPCLFLFYMSDGEMLTSRHVCTHFSHQLYYQCYGMTNSQHEKELYRYTMDEMIWHGCWYEEHLKIQNMPVLNYFKQVEQDRLCILTYDRAEVNLLSKIQCKS